MLALYIRIAIRNLWKNKWFSAINIFGLALGIATCLLIMLFVQNQLSYDRYNENADRIVRVVFRGKMQGGEIKEANVMPPVAQAFANDFPEVQEATRIRPYGTPRISIGDKIFREDAFAFADSNFFRVFTVPLAKGNKKTALVQPNTIVISRSAAKKYFGNQDPIGKLLVFKDNNNVSLTVTGVFDKIPAASHFHFNLIASMSTLPEAREQSWMVSNFFTYLLLPKGYDYKKLGAKLPQEVDKYIGPQLQKAMGVTLSQFRQSGNNIGFYLQPLTDIHLHSDLTGDMEPHGDIQYVYIFSAVAVFMLLIACINFMNLSTAGASKRAKEVGIKKVLGSRTIQLTRQFLAESLMLTGVAMVIALVFVGIAMPLFNSIAGQDLSLRLSDNLWIIPALLLFALFTGVLAGSYPSFFLSSFNPIKVLKGNFSTGTKSAGLRSGLVIFQFFISISLILGTLVVYKQLSYIQHKKLGYDKDQVLVIEGAWVLGKHQNAFKQQLLEDPAVRQVSASGYLPAGNSFGNNYMVYPDANTSGLIHTLRYEVDDSYIPTLGMQLYAGRNFSKDYGSDSTAMILNETAASAFGWGKDAIGHTINHTDNNGTKTTYHIIGIVKDFHFRSLHESITPLVMTMTPNDNSLIVKVKTKDIKGLLAAIKKKWESFTTEWPFGYSFLDDRFNNTYKAEQNIGTILGIFAGLTIFVACLGLFGLATFTAERRTKEIGIRKVLGANTGGIVSLLSKDFLKLVLVAFIIASPVAWFVMNKWLNDFAYRIRISWWLFAVTAIVALLITLFTVGFRAVKAATANPVKSLRTE